MTFNQLIHNIWLNIVICPFLTDAKGRLGPVEMRFILTQPAKAEDNILPFDLSHGDLRVLVRVIIVMLNGISLCFTGSFCSSANLIVFIGEVPRGCLVSRTN